MRIEYAGSAFGTVWKDASVTLEREMRVEDIATAAAEIRTAVTRLHPSWREIGTAVRPWGSRIVVLIQYAHDDADA